MADVILMATEVSKVMNNIFAQLPTRQQRVLKEYFEFKRKYVDYVASENADFDTLLKWREDINLLESTILGGINEINPK